MRRDEWFVHDVDVDFPMLEVDHVSTVLEGAGFDVEARLERKNYPDQYPPGAPTCTPIC